MNAYGLIVIDLRYTLPNIHYFIQAILTTSISSGPTSLSVLSISSYANQPGGDPSEPSISKTSNNNNNNTKKKLFSRTRYRTANPSEQQSISSFPTSTTTNDTHQRSSSLNGSIKTPLSSQQQSPSDEHGINHLTLQPIINNASPTIAPSPSTSTTSVSKNRSNSPKYGASPTAAFVGTPHAMAAPPTLDTVTTISNCNTSNHNSRRTSKEIAETS